GLYRHLLAQVRVDSPGILALKSLLDPDIFTDLHRFSAVSESLESSFACTLDPTGSAQLAWDSFRHPHSVDSSAAWVMLLESDLLIPSTVRSWLSDQTAEILSWNPDAVGISLISDSQLIFGLTLIGLLRRAAPRLRLIVGGDAISYRRSLLSRIPQLHSFADHVVGGDAEPFWSHLLASREESVYSNQVGLSDTPSELAQRFCRCDFSVSALPAWHLLPLNDYLTPSIVIPIETARGCPWGRCAFCIHPGRSPQGNPGYRLKPLDLLQRELESAISRGFHRFFFVDEALSEHRFREICALSASLSRPISWIAYARCDAPQQADFWKQVRRAGCRKLFFGLETGSDRLLQQYHKGTCATTIERTLRDVAEADIAFHVFLMTGFPGETAADRQATCNLLRRVLPNVDAFGFSYDLFCLQAELETPLFLHPESYACHLDTHAPHRDLAYQYPCHPLPATSELRQYADNMHSLIEASLAHRPGLRQVRLSQDSHHLLL
ncbi:MAG TPA: radical SAM protein, partial [Candidatus Ozemobacteraceae bacterium]|nr:radical SAM protein [Candidatus Ozemobacteraceae bacterium]